MKLARCSRWWSLGITGTALHSHNWGLQWFQHVNLISSIAYCMQATSIKYNVYLLFTRSLLYTWVNVYKMRSSWTRTVVIGDIVLILWTKDSFLSSFSKDDTLIGRFRHRRGERGVWYAISDWRLHVVRPLICDLYHQCLTACVHRTYCACSHLNHLKQTETAQAPQSRRTWKWGTRRHRTHELQKLQYRPDKDTV